MHKLKENSSRHYNYLLTKFIRTIHQCVFYKDSCQCEHDYENDTTNSKK